MTRPILIAGLLGGLLGGVAAFAANRWIVPTHAATAEAKPHIPIPKEARTAVEWYIAKLEAMQYNEFAAEVRRGMVKILPQERVDKVLKEFQQSREEIHRTLGNHTAPFELIRETAVSNELIRFVYLEKFEDNVVVWAFVVYQTKDGWRLVRFAWDPEVLNAFPNS
jgi:hypothetical protein